MARKPFKLAALSVDELIQLRDEVQTALAGKILMARDELQQKMEQLTALEAGAVSSSTRKGRGRQAARAKANGLTAHGKRRRKRPQVYIQYYDPETGLTYSNRGPMARWLRAKQEAGENIDKKYRVSASNPLPKKLAHLAPPH